MNSPCAEPAWRFLTTLCHARAYLVFRSQSASNRPPAPRLLCRRVWGGGSPGQRVLSWQAQSYQKGIKCWRRTQAICSSASLIPFDRIHSVKSRAANRNSVLVDGTGAGACAMAQAAARDADHPCRTLSSNAGHHANSRQRGRRVPSSLARRRVLRMRFGRRLRGLSPRRRAGSRASLTRPRPPFRRREPAAADE